MKKINFIQKPMLLLAAVCTLTAFYGSSCKKEDEPTNTTKTLDKAKLYDKKWYNKGGSSIMEIKTGGIYKNDGSWRWINNSDTMEIIGTVGEPAVLWKFYWSSDKEMACNLVGHNDQELYKDAPW